MLFKHISRSLCQPSPTRSSLACNQASKQPTNQPASHPNLVNFYLFTFLRAKLCQKNVADVIQHHSTSNKIPKKNIFIVKIFIYEAEVNAMGVSFCWQRCKYPQSCGWNGWPRYRMCMLQLKSKYSYMMDGRRDVRRGAGAQGRLIATLYVHNVNTYICST